jgi:hypothetical protein
MTPNVGLSPVHTLRGRALLVDRDGSLYVGRRQRIYRSRDLGVTWQLDAEIPTAAWKTALAWSRLACRALRHEISGLVVLSDGTRLAIARDGIFRAAANDSRMVPVFRFVRGSRPLNLCVNATGDILFGEYGRNPKRHEMFVYASRDRGSTFEVVHAFGPGSVRHIHSVIHDAYLDAYWVLAGDYGKEPGIGLLSRDFEHLEWVARGEQQVRAVNALVEPDCLIYGTDTELEQNYIVRLDKKTGRRDLLVPTNGSSLFAARYGDQSRSYRQAFRERACR